MEQKSSTPPANSTPKKSAGASNALAVILAIAFVFFAVVGLIGFDIWRVLFNPTLVKQTLTTEIVSSDLAPALLKGFSEWRAEQRVKNNESLSGVGEPDIVLLISFVDMDGWREIKQLLVSDDFVTHLVSVSVDGLYNWIDSEDPWPNITWEMVPFKERMNGKQGIDAIMVAYSALPDCTEAEIVDFRQRVLQAPPGVEVLYDLCAFPEPWHDDQVNDYIEALGSINENIPARLNFSEVFGLTSSSTVGTSMLKGQLRLLRLIAQWGWLIALILLLVILGIKVRSKRSLGQFIGIPLAVSGVLVILIAWVGQVSIIQFVTESLVAATTAIARQEVESSLKHLTSLFFQPLLIQGIILAGSGAVLILLMFVRNTKAKATQST
jgi:hypothetical protein